MAASKDGRRKGLLPLHIDTRSFTDPQQQNGYPWIRFVNKRQLPLYILLFLLFVSVCFNLFGRHRRHRPMLINDPLPAPPLERHHHAIIVAGHAIYTGSTSEDLTSDDHWILEPFQKGGQITAFVAHIQKALELAKADPAAVLIFSGGQTRPKAGPRSEGLSYWQIAQMLLDESDKEVTQRMAVEEFARDSHENLLFSICRFSELTGQYPSTVTLVGFEFKRKRFEDVHAQSLRFPSDRFTYIGIDPPGPTDGLLGAESEYSLKPFQKDRYGCQGSLRQKKIDRNPFRRRYPYRQSCPALADLFNFCPTDNQVFNAPLPWDT